MKLRRLQLNDTVHLLPNLFTAANFVLGIRAITLVLKGDGYYDMAASCLMLAMLCDVMDGLVARLTNTTSEFGAELDSLADLVSFGVAPAVMVYRQSLIIYDAAHWRGPAHVGFLICAVYAGCAALRLARFNLHTVEESTSFIGLPSPAAAGVIAAYFMLVESGLLPQAWTDVATHWLLPFITAALGILMVSTIRYPAPAKQLMWRTRSFYIFAAGACVIALMLASRGATLFVLFTGYALFGVIRAARKASFVPRAIHRGDP
jgi:CDP-diacylglycerol--serine O-phosphatidyltransferase